MKILYYSTSKHAHNSRGSTHNHLVPAGRFFTAGALGGGMVLDEAAEDADALGGGTVLDEAAEDADGAFVNARPDPVTK